jgi:hypothetical protein
LAGLFFCGGLQPVVQAIEVEVPTLALNAWYCDDGQQVGTREELIKVVDILLREGRPRGLILSTAATVSPPSLPKTSIWSPGSGVDEDEQDPLQRGVPRVSSGSGITVLGAPVGSAQYVREVMESRIQKIKEITGLLPNIKDPHCEFVLLRSCLALPKVMFLLRALDTSPCEDLLEEFDAITRDALSNILGPPVTDLQWEQAKLPVPMGGAGLRAALDHAPVAYAASFLAAQPLVRNLLGRRDEEASTELPQPLLDCITARQGEEATMESLEGVPQKIASLAIDLNNQAMLVNHYKAEGCKREIARMASLGLPHSGDWLSVVPCPALGLYLRGPEFLVSLKYRLGVPVFSAEAPCPACQHPSDVMGDHALGCARHGERIARHNLLRDVLYEAAAAASLGPAREGRYLLPGTSARPADLLIPRWCGGKDAALDVTVTSPLAKSNVVGASEKAGAALEKAVKRKIQGAAEACRQQGLAFIPVAAETLGGLHTGAVEQVRRLGAALSRQTGQEEGEAKRHLFQRLSLHLMRGNAALLVNRSPDFPSPEVDGVE